MTTRFSSLTLLVAVIFLASCSQPKNYDLILRNAMIYDGSGEAPIQGDLAISGDTIAALGNIGAAKAKKEIDVNGMAVSPGFVNMLSWATESLLIDGRAMSDIKQGVTLEVMGEGGSMGPLNPQMKKDMIGSQGDIHFDVNWTTLGEYLTSLEKKGIAPNVASF
jgi:N-acyl-D-amino-acid deacylase